jgi:membrane-bound lytic murein transglycosylase B
MRFWLLMFALISAPAVAQDESGFADWLQQFRTTAVAEGIGLRGLGALDTAEFKERIIELDQEQPEKRLTLAEYMERTLNPKRIEQGHEMMAEHRGALRRIQQLYGIPPAIIVALWGKETNYGANTGGFYVVDALATLAYEGRRAEYFAGELLNSLRIIDAGHIAPDDMKGSWAGAMGQCQFMPTSFFKYAVDGDANGTIDIWTDLNDVFASMANYLHTEGWNAAEGWGQEVRLTRTIPESQMGLEVQQTLARWAQMGITNPDGTPLPNIDLLASLVQPDGPGTNAYLVTGNFRVLMHWNRSRYFGISVGTLADMLQGDTQ